MLSDERIAELTAKARRDWERDYFDSDVLAGFYIAEAERDALRAQLADLEARDVFARECIASLNGSAARLAEENQAKDAQLAEAEPIIAAVAKGKHDPDAFTCGECGAAVGLGSKHEATCPIEQARAYQAKYARADAEHAQPVGEVVTSAEQVWWRLADDERAASDE